MEEINGATLFWLLALGIFIGLFAQLAMGKKGVGFIPNLAGGAAGALVMGILGLKIALPGSLLFALLGSLSILFLMNVFSAGSGHDSGVKIDQRQL